MRLLLVFPCLPYPPITGNAMIALNHIRHLAQRHTLDLLTFKGDPNTGDMGDLPKLCGDIELIDPPSGSRRIFSMLKDVANKPFEASLLQSPAMSTAIDRRLASGNYDAAIFQMSAMAQYWRPDSRLASIWNLEDPPSLKYERMLDMWPWYFRPLAKLRVARTRGYERGCAPKFDRVLFVTKDEAQAFGDLIPGSKTDWVPSGMDVEEFSPDPSVARREGMIVITGNMGHTPNVDAVEYFCREIYPLVRKEVANASLWLVGSRPAPAVQALTADPSIKVTGFVQDVRPYLREAVVSVCAVRLRIGTQTKVLEALACETPVVTTSAGNHGVMGTSGENLYVADEPQEFAGRVVSLLRRERWDDLSRNGRRHVVENFTWEASTARLERILEECVANRAAKGVSA